MLIVIRVDLELVAGVMSFCCLLDVVLATYPLQYFFIPGVFELIALDDMRFCDFSVLRLLCKSMMAMSTTVITNTRLCAYFFDCCLLKFKCKQTNLEKYWIEFFKLQSYPPDIPIASISFLTRFL